jgi:hypothetical protein
MRIIIVLEYREHYENVILVASSVEEQLVRSYEMRFSHEITTMRIIFRSSLSDSKPELTGSWYIEFTAAWIKRT